VDAFAPPEILFSERVIAEGTKALAEFESDETVLSDAVDLIEDNNGGASDCVTR